MLYHGQNSLCVMRHAAQALNRWGTLLTCHHDARLPRPPLKAVISFPNIRHINLLQSARPLLLCAHAAKHISVIDPITQRDNYAGATVFAQQARSLNLLQRVQAPSPQSHQLSGQRTKLPNTVLHLWSSCSSKGHFRRASRQQSASKSSSSALSLVSWIIHRPDALHANKYR